MSKMIQIRHVPDVLHRKLKARAAQEGLSLSDFLLKEFEHLADQPSKAELRDRLARLSPVHLSMPPAEAIRDERDRR